MIPYKPPEHRERVFNCPHCKAYAHQYWGKFYLKATNSKYEEFSGLEMAKCIQCENYTLWHSYKSEDDYKMIYPEDPGVQPANLDLEDNIKEDYKEAASIVNKSPRGAVALLRLCIQKLCKQLGESGKDINDDIANLVKKGLPAEIQKAFDIVRLIGNYAVHPEEVDLKEDRELAMALFGLINLIAERMITQPKKVGELYDSLPQAARDKIQNRDKGGSTP